MGQPQRAIQDYGEAIRLDPQDADAHYLRGIAYDELGQPQRAIQDYDDAIRLDPQDADAYANRALALTLLDIDAEAQQDIDRAIGLGFDRALLMQTIEQARQAR